MLTSAADPGTRCTVSQLTTSSHAADARASEPQSLAGAMLGSISRLGDLDLVALISEQRSRNQAGPHCLCVVHRSDKRRAGCSMTIDDHTFAGTN